MSSLPPETAVPQRIGLAGLAGFIFGLIVVSWLGLHPALRLVALLACAALPMWWLEWRRFPPGTSSAPLPMATRTFRRRQRLWGLLVAIGLWGGVLSIVPLADSGTLAGFWDAMLWLWPLPVVVAVSYVVKQSESPPTGLELIGEWVSTSKARPSFPWGALRDQLVKAFFLPLMLAFAYAWGVQASAAQGLHWYFVPMALMYLADTIFSAIGYLSTSRRVDAHIRSSNPYWSGWVAALVCYPPFFIWLKEAGFNYRDGYLWYDWLGGAGLVAWSWGGAIIMLTAIYVWATVVFGIRFSNLTNRGIITSGPYRHVKHPAYLSKNISWWLISVPFISTAGFKTAVLHCLILFGMNGIYYLRAVTEERHLRSDPAYREYAAWISENGLFARFRRLRWERSQSYRS